MTFLRPENLLHGQHGQERRETVSSLEQSLTAKSRPRYINEKSL